MSFIGLFLCVLCVLCGSFTSAIEGCSTEKAYSRLGGLGGRIWTLPAAISRDGWSAGLRSGISVGDCGTAPDRRPALRWRCPEAPSRFGLRKSCSPFPGFTCKKKPSYESSLSPEFLEILDGRRRGLRAVAA